MECVGFKKPAIKWFKSYLSNRKCVVSIEGGFSEEGLLTCGVPERFYSRITPFQSISTTYHNH